MIPTGEQGRSHGAICLPSVKGDPLDDNVHIHVRAGGRLLASPLKEFALGLRIRRHFPATVGTRFARGLFLRLQRSINGGGRHAHSLRGRHVSL